MSNRHTDRMPTLFSRWTSLWPTALENLLFRYFDRIIPARWYLASVPSEQEINSFTGRLQIELVSHCWQYSHLLAYHLSALVHYPPETVDITVTVFYSKEDGDTQNMLDFFTNKSVPGITWNWREIPKAQLFRRAIGRNQAALQTQAHWIWYIDCDLIFHQGCLDSLAKSLQGQKEVLLFPDSESTTSLLEDSNPILKNGHQPQLVDIDTTQFSKREITRAVGAYQITHGDIARACGYCNNIQTYQTPTLYWRKTYEDRTYRWLLRTQGKSIKVNNIYRIRHVSKGRYKKGTLWSKLRSYIRITESRLNE